MRITFLRRYYYYLQVLGIHPNGNLTAVIGDNAVTVKFSLSFDSQGCHFKLKELKMVRLGDVQVTLTGLYPFDTWSSRLASKVCTFTTSGGRNARNPISTQGRLKDIKLDVIFSQA